MPDDHALHGAALLHDLGGCGDTDAGANGGLEVRDDADDDT